jgi:hypothetical protein
VSKRPDRAGVDLHVAIGQFTHELLDRDIAVRQASTKIYRILARNEMGPMTSHLTGGNAASRPLPGNPPDHRRGTKIKRLRYRSGALASLNESYGTFSKVYGVGFSHSCWPPSPARSLNHKPEQMGIPRPIQPQHIPL